MSLDLHGSPKPDRTNSLLFAIIKSQEKGTLTMDINTFIDNFAGQFDETDRSVFVAETKFRDLDEWSSLIALSIIAMVDEEYEVTLKGDDIKNAQTIQDIFETVKAKKA